MELGYINFSQEELNRKNKVLQMVREQTAIDELGFGRIRDAFSNLMFPGISTLQRHAKYFAVMPTLFYCATGKRYNNVREVRNQIIDWEIRLTEMLVEGANGDKNLLTGITGSSMVQTAKKDRNKFVKYDPAYIYINGLRTFGMVKSNADIYQLIYERSKHNANGIHKYIAQDEEELSDDDDLSGERQLFSVSGEVYDFDHGTSVSLDLTEREAIFLKTRITSSEGSKDSLLSYILMNKVNVVPQYEDLHEVWKNLPDNYLKQYRMGLRFSHFAYVIQLRYNYIAAQFNEQNDHAEVLAKRIHETRETHFADFTSWAIDEMLDFIEGRVSETTVISFTRKAAKLVEENNWAELDKLIVSREKAVKPGRHKLLNDKYKGEKREMPTMMSFRWNEIVYRVITEIRKAIRV